jgi:hypothetical protein
MLSPEAVHLVLHAAAQKTPGLVYVLEMGDQIKLIDLAKNLIRLAGFVPDEEIPITFVGLRPGEKLYEELVGPNEDVSPSPVEKVLQVSLRALPTAEQLRQQVSMLERLARLGDASGVVRQIGAIVAEFQPPSAQTSLVPAPATDSLRIEATPVTKAAAAQTTCPICGHPRKRRSRIRSLRRPRPGAPAAASSNRCPDCGWSGWLPPSTKGSDKPAGDSRNPDFRSIDLGIRPRTAKHHRPFSPQDVPAKISH